MNSYQLSMQLHQAHTIYGDGTVDCNHWCAPGLSEVSPATAAAVKAPPWLTQCGQLPPCSATAADNCLRQTRRIALVQVRCCSPSHNVHWLLQG
jgi:hypothetical protein